MLKRIIVVAVMALIGSAAYTQQVVQTQTSVAFLRVKNADGSYSYSHGAKIPVTIVAIPRSEVSENGRAARLRKALRNGASLFNQQAFSATNLTVFQNDSGPYIAGDTVDSALDDLSLANGSQNKAWKIVTFGVNFPDPFTPTKFLVRWLGYNTMTPGLGPGVSEFSGLMFDFGFYLDRSIFPSGDTFQVTVDLTLNPLAIVPNQTCFFAQQFREPQIPEQGEGAFTDVNNVFNDNVGPVIGTSQDVFWFDNPPDGIYDETEPDNFGPDHVGAGTFMLNIQVGSGNTTTLSPASFQWLRGLPVSGSLGSLWFNDVNYLVAKAGPTLFAAEPPAQLKTETFVSTTAITSLRIDVVSHVSTPNLNIKVDAFDFTTNQYVNLFDGPASTGDQTTIAFAETPSHFVDPGTNTIRSRVSFYRVGPTLNWPWSVFVNMIKYTVTDS